MARLLTLSQKLDEMRYRGKNDLFYLATRILGFSRMTTWHQKIAEKCQEKRQKPIRLWLLPRGFYKTSLLNIAHNIFLLLNNPSERILVGSAVLANSKDMVSETGDIFIRNELFRNLYPQYCPENVRMPDTTWTKSQIELPNRKDFAKMEKSIEAHGADTAVVSRHYTYMKFDDLVTPGFFETPELRKKIFDYFKACLALKDMPDTPIDVIGTRWHDSDLYGELEKWNDVETIKIPATYIKDGYKKSIFPEVYPLSILENLKINMGSYLYSALYMLDPVPEEMQTFKSSWWVHFDWVKEFDEQTGYQKMRREDDGEIIPIGHRFMCSDVAKKGDKGDYSTSMVITTDSENNWYILDMWRGQVLPMALADKLIEMSYYWFPNVVGIETITYELMLKLYVDAKMRREGIVLPVQAIDQGNRLSKELKIKALQPMFESKCIYFPRNHPLTPVLKEELERFPRGKNDDLADTLQMFRELVFPSRNFKIKSKGPNSLDAWKDKLKRWHKDKVKFFKDYQADYNKLMGKI